MLFEFDQRIFSTDTIKKALYRLGGDYDSLEIRGNMIQVILPGGSALSRERVNREVLDQDLRERVAVETEGVRNLLLAHSFSLLSLTSPELDGCQFHDTPCSED